MFSENHAYVFYRIFLQLARVPAGKKNQTKIFIPGFLYNMPNCSNIPRYTAAFSSNGRG